MSVLLSFDDEHYAYNLVSCAIYNNIGSPTFGAAKIGLVTRMAFISSNPTVVVSVRFSFDDEHRAYNLVCCSYL